MDEDKKNDPKATDDESETKVKAVDQATGEPVVTEGPAAEEDQASEEEVSTEVESETEQEETDDAEQAQSETTNEVLNEIEDATSGLNDENPDKVEEYFETKRVVKTLRRDLKDLKENHPDYEEYQKKNKEVKQLRDKINHTEDVRILSEKISTLRERMDLIKEIIKMELVELEQSERKHEGRVLKLVQTLKEMRDEEEA